MQVLKAKYETLQSELSTNRLPISHILEMLREGDWPPMLTEALVSTAQKAPSAAEVVNLNACPLRQ